MKPLRIKISRTIIVLCLAVAVTECGIARFFSTHLTPAQAKLQIKTSLSKEGGLDYALLVLGDSSAAEAINAELLQQASGLSCFNFALVGNALIAGNYYILKDYLVHNKPPRYLIIMNVYDIWSRTPATNTFTFFTAYFPEYTKILLKDSLAHNDGYKEIAETLLNYFLAAVPSLKYKYEIRGIIEKRGAAGLLAKTGKKYATYQRQIVTQRGNSSYFQKNLKEIEKNIASQTQYIASSSFQVSAINLYYLEKLLRETEEKNIRVFICFPPLLDEFYEQGKDSVHLTDYTSFIKNIPNRYGHVTLLTDTFYTVPKGHLAASIDHIDEETSVAFTKMLAEKLSNVLGAAQRNRR